MNVFKGACSSTLPVLRGIVRTALLGVGGPASQPLSSTTPPGEFAGVVYRRGSLCATAERRAVSLGVIDFIAETKVRGDAYNQRTLHRRQRREPSCLRRDRFVPVGCAPPRGATLSTAETTGASGTLSASRATGTTSSSMRSQGPRRRRARQPHTLISDGKVRSIHAGSMRMCPPLLRV